MGKSLTHSIVLDKKSEREKNLPAGFYLTIYADFRGNSKAW